jgi:hypothetical protein
MCNDILCHGNARPKPIVVQQGVSRKSHRNEIDSGCLVDNSQWSGEQVQVHSKQWWHTGDTCGYMS